MINRLFKLIAASRGFACYSTALVFYLKMKSVYYRFCADQSRVCATMRVDCAVSTPRKDAARAPPYTSTPTTANTRVDSAVRTNALSIILSIASVAACYC